MKNLLKSKFVRTICNLCLAYATLIVAHGVCIIMYGEPTYPTEE